MRFVYRRIQMHNVYTHVYKRTCLLTCLLACLFTPPGSYSDYCAFGRWTIGLVTIVAWLQVVNHATHGPAKRKIRTRIKCRNTTPTLTRPLASHTHTRANAHTDRHVHLHTRAHNNSTIKPAPMPTPFQQVIPTPATPTPTMTLIPTAILQISTAPLWIDSLGPRHRLPHNQQRRWLQAPLPPRPQIQIYLI